MFSLNVRSATVVVVHQAPLKVRLCTQEPKIQANRISYPQSVTSHSEVESALTFVSKVTKLRNVVLGTLL